MKRAAVGLFLLVSVLACQENPTSVRGPNGGLALDVQLNVSAAALDGGRVIIRGPTDTTLGLLPGTVDTVAGLLPGAYDVALEGLINGEVEVFGQRSGVQVVAGDHTVANLTLESFRPQLGSMADTVPSATVDLAFSSVASADSYVVELDRSTTFATPHEASTTDTTVAVTVDVPGLYHARVRAFNAFGGRGRPSELDSTDVVFAVFTSVSVGVYHVCGASQSGDAYCWGSASQANLGTGQENIVPGEVLGGIAFETVEAGNGVHTCGRAQDGRVLCWGRNKEGQTGIGMMSDSVIVPTEAELPANADRVTAGGSHSCAITTGDGYCWGHNGLGALGTGNVNDEDCGGTPCRTAPTLVDGIQLFTWISAGNSYSCGVSASPEGTYCWGENGFGTLGDGTTQSKNTPTQVSGGHTFVEVEAGAVHTCAVTDEGVGYCWGLNQYGQLGTGTAGDSSLVPVQVSGGLTFQSIVPGTDFTCGLTEDGAAYCWGSNRRGNLGTGDELDSLVPVAVIGGHTFTDISAAAVTACGVTTEGSLYCWGSNEFGQLGDGTMEHRTAPTKVLFSR